MKSRDILKLICIIGPDGVGKTTQSKLLIKELEQRSIKSDYLWMRWNHKLSLPILALARILRLSKIVRLKCGKKIVYHFFNKNKSVSFIYQWTSLIDTLLSVIFKVYIRSMKDTFLICDRYVYDVVVDLAISTRNPMLIKSVITRLFLSLAGKSTVITLMASQELLRVRKYDVSEDDDLKLKIYLYKFLSKRYNIPIINAEKSIFEVHSNIMNVVGETINET